MSTRSTLPSAPSSPTWTPDNAGKLPLVEFLANAYEFLNERPTGGVRAKAYPGAVGPG